MDEHIVTMIDELLSRLEHMDGMDGIERLEALRVERSLLLQKIELCKKAFEKTADIILKITEILSLLKIIAQRMKKRQAAAERKWLAYWGIVKRDETRIGTRHGMQQLSSIGIPC